MSQRSQKKRKTSYNSFSNVSSSPLYPRGPRTFTLSVALPSSILSNLPTEEQKLHLIARISRCLAIFSIDEVIVFNDSPPPTAINHASYTGDSDHAHFLTQLLSFLECPPFMRKALFPIHPNLRHTSLLPTLDTPHHPNPKDPWIPFREGVTISSGPDGTLVDTGLDERVLVYDEIPPNTRVTLQFTDPDATSAECVHPDTPKTQGGYYWGYTIRSTSSLSGVFTECPYQGGYDVSIGTSQRGSDVMPTLHQQFQHLLVVLGGPRGLEYAAANDPKLAGMGIKSAKTGELFDHWLNVIPNQGTRAISTDEALPIALSALKPLWDWQ